MRKRSLVAASELNRVRLQEEWQSMTDGVHSLAGRVKSAGSLASAAALFVAGVSAWRCGKAAPADRKPSWFRTALKGARVVGSAWLAFRARSR